MSESDERSIQEPHPATDVPVVKKHAELDEYLVWGGVPIPKHALTAPHFLLLGLPKSGKTWAIRMLMNTVLGKESFQRNRALVFDIKKEALPILDGLGVPLSRIIVLHPFDSRGAAWDIAEDLTERASIKQFATTICPTESNVKDPYWTRAASEIVAGIIHSLIATRGKEWGLWDIVDATESPEEIRRVLGFSKYGRKRIHFFLDQGKEAVKGVLSTLLSNIGRIEEVAELWRTAKTRVSLRKWCESSSVLVLGIDAERADVIAPICRAIFQRVTELVASREEENPLDETWFFIDEMRELGKLDGLRMLMNLGRSKGARVVIGAQDKHGLSAVYGNDEALEIMSAASNVGIHAIGCPETARWASKYFGEYECLEREVTESRPEFLDEISWTGKGYRGPSIRTFRRMKPAVLQQQFLRLPLADPVNGLCGVYSCDVMGIWASHLSPEEVRRLAPDKGGEAGFVPRLGKGLAKEMNGQQETSSEHSLRQQEKYRFRTMKSRGD